MKNIFSRFSVLLLVLSVVPSLTFAQGYDASKKTEIYLETLRTEDAPGFFKAKIIPAETLEPLRMREVYVKNYSNQEAFLYDPLVSIIKDDLDGQFVSIEAVDLLLGNPHNRITFLGEKDPKRRKHTKHFQIKNPEDKLEEFEAFHSKELPAVYAYNLKVNWDKTNVSEVYPSPENNTRHLTEEGLTFIGKFEESKPTFLHVLGATNKGVLKAQALLSLDDSGFIDSYEAFNLPQTWEAYYNHAHPDTPKPKPNPGNTPDTPNHPLWLKVLLIVLLIGFVLFIIREFYKCSHCQKKELNGLVYDDKKGFVSHKPKTQYKKPEHKTVITKAQAKPHTTKPKPTPKKNDESKTITMKMEMKKDGSIEMKSKGPIDDLPFSVEKKK